MLFFYSDLALLISAFDYFKFIDKYRYSGVKFWIAERVFSLTISEVRTQIVEQNVFIQIKKLFLDYL